MGRHRSSSTEGQRIRRRARARGAALGESVFVLFCLGSFLYVVPYAHGAFATAYEAQGVTRDRSLGSGVRGCFGSTPGTTTAPTSVESGGSEASGLSGQYAQTSSFTSGAMNALESVESRRVSYPMFTTTVRGLSFGTCNERPVETSVEGTTTNGFDRNSGSTGLGP